MAVKVGINGFGRIGRNVFRTAIGNPDIEFVAVNDLTTPATLAHLLKYDSILGNLKNEITHGADFIAIDGKKIKVFAERDPAKLDWASVGAEWPMLAGLFVVCGVATRPPWLIVPLFLFEALRAVGGRPALREPWRAQVPIGKW